MQTENTAPGRPIGASRSRRGRLSGSLLATLLLATVAIGCDSNEDGSSDPTEGLGNVPYDLDSPAASFDLPPALLEISGIALLPDGQIGAVQDEEGAVFFIDATTGSVTDSKVFGEPGDYEDLAVVGDRIFVLRADGVLFEFETGLDGGVAAAAHESGLRPRHDPEGLAFDSAQNRLLIACKGHPGGDLDENEVRSIYAFDLESGALSDEPSLVMNRDTIDAVVRGGGNFAPSAVGIRPGTNELYVLSSDLRALVVYGPDGSLRAARSLSDDLFEQPEGLLFLPNGDLYIASEGVDGPGVLHRFKS